MLRNFLLPVNKLPPEVLSKVLEHRGSERDLVAATHVCRYWRSSIISSPTLWTRLQYHKDIGRTYTYLERSKSVPVDIEINLELHKRNRISFGPLVSLIGKARSLKIYGPNNSVQEAIRFASCSHAPFLQHLEIDSWLDEDHGQDVIWFPDDFPGRHTPALLSVNFTNALPALKSHSPLLNLTRFKLLFRRSMGELRASALFLFLSSSPQLKEVSIRILTTMIGDITPNTFVSLESLEELEYRCSRSGVRVLPSMRLPGLKMLAVETRADTLVDLLPFDGHLLLSETTAMVYCHRRKTLRKAEFCGSGVRIEVSSTSLSEGTNPVDWFSDTHPIAFSRIQRLVVKDVSGAAFSGVIELPVAAFENLEVLHVFECPAWYVDGICRTLSPRDEGDISCRFLQDVNCKCPKAFASLDRLAKERKRVGSQFRLYYL